MIRETAMTGDVGAPPTCLPAGTIRPWLDRHAAENGDRIIHVFLEQAPLTWAELRDGAQAAARSLPGQGVAPGETAALMAPNGEPAVLALFGAFYGGFRTALVDLAAGPEAVG